MFVFLDIGATLITGPAAAPARRLAARLGLSDQAADDLRDRLLTSPLASPDDLSDLLVRRFGVEPAAAAGAAGEIWEAQAAEARPLPGARETLRRLREDGIRYGFISNIWRPYFEGFTRVFADFLPSAPALLSFEAGVRKPSAAIYERALGAAGVEPAAAVMVGDCYENDIAPALRAGMRTVWVLHRPDKEASHLARVKSGAAPAPHLTLESIAELHPRVIPRLAATSRGER